MDKDTLLLNLIYQVAERHNCKIADIDFDKHIISIEGEPCDEESCAMELMMVLGEVGDGE